MLKTKVISVRIRVIFPNVDWSTRDYERFWGWFWDQFWPLCTIFPRIPLIQILHWEKEKSRSICLNWDGFLRVDWFKVLLFRLCFLFNNSEDQSQGVTITGSYQSSVIIRISTYFYNRYNNSLEIYKDLKNRLFK